MTHCLIIKLRGIGDAVLATPAIQALKQSDPHLRVTAVMPAPAAQVLEHHPDLDQTFTWIKGREISLGLELRKEGFDWAAILHANFRGAWLGYLSGAKVRVVHDHGGKPYFTTLKVPDPTARKSAVERDLDAVRTLGIPVPEGLKPRIFLTGEEEAWAKGFLSRQGIPGEITLAVAIGGSAPSKRWPAERFGKLCSQLSTAGRVRILLLTTPDDQALLPIYFAACPREKVIPAHGLPIRQVMALLRASRMFIGNDSGIKHIACALGISTLTLFGPEDLEEWHPYKPEDGHEVIIKDVPCRGRGCGLLDCEPLSCLKEISVEEVSEKARSMLSKSVP